MILDKENLFSEKQAITATAAAPNLVDLGPGDAGPAEGLSLVVTGEPYGGAGSLVVELKTADALNAGRTDLDTPVIVATYAVPNAALVKGGKLVGARLPHGMKRFAAVNYVVTGTVTGGKITAGLVWDVQAELK